MSPPQAEQLADPFEHLDQQRLQHMVTGGLSASRILS
jgi:hypothetical protein